MNKYLKLSFMIHAAFFILVSQLSIGSSQGKDKEGNPQGGGSKNVKTGEFIPKSEPTEITLIEKEKDGVGKSRKKKKDCKNSYGGIGIVWTYDNIVQEVAKGYIADRSGIVPGDVLVLPNIDEVRGEPGTNVQIILIRNGIRINKTLMRELICLDK